MKAILVCGACLLAMSGPSFAAGNHDHGHDSAHGIARSAAGVPGDPAQVNRAIDVRMFESDAQMLYEPRSITVTAGETIRFVVTNDGTIEHELVIDTAEGNALLKAEIANAAGGAHHHGPNAVMLQPGEAGEVVWRFTEPGTFEFACLLPGHQELGMAGPIKVLPAAHHTHD